jgi:hypothetical protein
MHSAGFNREWFSPALPRKQNLSLASQGSLQVGSGPERDFAIVTQQDWPCWLLSRPDLAWGLSSPLLMPFSCCPSFFFFNPFYLYWV